MEIMGLALVVILISLGILFAVKFSAMKPATSGARGAYIKTVKASNMLNTLLKVNTECAAGATVTQLIQDCASGNPQLTSCPNPLAPLTLLDSCGYIKSIIGDGIIGEGIPQEGIFDKTFGEWGQDFYFVIKKGGTIITDIGQVGTECQGIKESKNQPIPVTGGLVTVTLDLCG